MEAGDGDLRSVVVRIQRVCSVETGDGDLRHDVLTISRVRSVEAEYGALRHVIVRLMTLLRGLLSLQKNRKFTANIVYTWIPHTDSSW